MPEAPFRFACGDVDLVAISASDSSECCMLSFSDGSLPPCEKALRWAAGIRGFYARVSDVSLDAYNADLRANREKERLHRRAAISRTVRRVAGHVYLLECRGLHKIGKARIVGRRIYQIGLKMPVPPVLLRTIDCDDHIAAEAALHRQFAGKCVHGEWFNLVARDIGFIRSLVVFKSGEWRQK